MSGKSSHAIDQPLPARDVQAIVRLVGETCAVTGGAPARRRFLLSGLARLLEADVWMWLHTRTEEHQATPFAMVDGGWKDARQKALMIQAVLHPYAHEKLYGPLRQRLRGEQRYATVRVEEVISDKELYTSEYYRKVRAPTGCDRAMISVYQVDEQTISGIGMHRLIGRPPFTVHQQQLLHLVVGEVEWLHCEGARVPAADLTLGLSPRLQQVLLLMLGGDSRKQIAHRLGLSEHTISDYIKALHRHFKVSSHGELLAKFMGGQTTLQLAPPGIGE